MKSPNLIKPPFKIPGGKTKLLPSLIKHLPKTLLKDQDWSYVEPFLGGGALFLKLKSENKVSQCFLNDYNFDIWNIWTVLKNSLSSLDTYCLEYQNSNSKEFFLKIRSGLTPVQIENINSSEFTVPTGPERAAQFLYLNKTCFNGLIRYNSSGEFNSPYGSYKNPEILDLVNATKINSLLNGNIKISWSDFQASIENIIKLVSQGRLDPRKTLVYLDPPYLPITKTANFTSYTKSGFGLHDQKRLRTCLDSLHAVGVKFMLSNSFSSLTREVFKGYKFHKISAPRSVGAHKDTRKKVFEYIIKNY